MAYSEALAAQIRALLPRSKTVMEKKMFGGVGFMIHGNMACGVHRDNLIVRVGAERYDDALKEPGAHEFDITGRPLKGWVLVGPAGCSGADNLERWVRLGVDFARSLPPK